MGISRHIHILTLVFVSIWIAMLISLRHPETVDILYKLSIIFISIWIIDSIYHATRIRRVLKKFEKHIMEAIE